MHHLKGFCPFLYPVVQCGDWRQRQLDGVIGARGLLKQAGGPQHGTGRLETANQRRLTSAYHLLNCQGLPCATRTPPPMGMEA